MSSAHDELPTADKNEIMELIYTDHDITNKNKLRPVAITNIQGSNFFPWHNNTYDGYFFDVNYIDHTELWFAVDVRGGLSDNSWFLERIR